MIKSAQVYITQYARNCASKQQYIVPPEVRCPYVENHLCVTCSWSQYYCL